MSLEAYIWAANLPLSRCNGTPFRVLLQLADRADKLGYGAYPSIGTIAETLECSDRTVQRAVKELREAGLIREGDQRFVSHVPQRYRPVVYDVLTTALVYTEARGDIPVTPEQFRGDKNGHSGVTTVVTQTVLNPSYQDTPGHLTLVTARESGTGQ
jgi:DNA-binding transcriptional MocR family regulator